MGHKEFYQALSICAERLRTHISDGKDISITAKDTPDGVVSAGILTYAIFTLGSKCSIRFVPDLTPDLVLKVKSDSHDQQIFVDLGTGLSTDIRNSFGNNWLVISHDNLSSEEIITDDENCILNPCKYEIDGHKEISSGGISYLIAKSIDKKFNVLSYLAVISALAEKQDVGEKRSLLGINSEICDESVRLGIINKEMDLLLSSRDSAPFYISLAQTIYPYIHGLTWNEKNCFDIVTLSGIPIKKDGRWRTSSELTQEEKFQLIEAVTNFVKKHSKVRANNLENLLAGYSFTLENEEQGSLLREARDFSFMLDCCCIESKPSIGLAVCIGNRTKYLSEAEKCLRNIEDHLKHTVLKIMSEKWRISDMGMSVWINGDAITKDYNLCILSSLLSGYNEFYGKTIVVRTETTNSNYKYLIMELQGSPSSKGVSTQAHRIANELGGISKRTDTFVECIVPFSMVDDFDLKLKRMVEYPEKK
jgi:RecJ-like exonuclease